LGTVILPHTPRLPPGSRPCPVDRVVVVWTSAIVVGGRPREAFTASSECALLPHQPMAQPGVQSQSRNKVARRPPATAQRPPVVQHRTSATSPASACWCLTESARGAGKNGTHTMVTAQPVPSRVAAQNCPSPAPSSSPPGKSNLLALSGHSVRLHSLNTKPSHLMTESGILKRHDHWWRGRDIVRPLLARSTTTR